MIFPEMVRIRQVIDAPRLVDIEGHLSGELEAAAAQMKIEKGARLAITAGSRGIAGIDRILRCLVAFFKAKGAEPFLVSSMGSHGGGTARGQREVLEGMNITEATMGVPIVASMEVVEIGRSSFGFPVLVDKHAAEADGIVVVNRIKPHTEFEGPIESGLMKMMAIGLGKHQGCFAVHQQTVTYGYRRVIPEVGTIILNKLPVKLGVGIVENIYDETAVVQAILPSCFEEEEKQLLARAKGLMARLPFDEIDVLVVDQIGKNISGSGMDTNVIGRIMFVGEKEPERPKITRIVVLGLTEGSHGNAAGIGLADFTTRRTVEKIDLEALAVNAIAAMTPEKGRIPIALETDRGAVEAALQTIGAIPPQEARLVHIKNTLELAELEVSKTLLPIVEEHSSLEIVAEKGALAFDEAGNLNSNW